MPLIVESQVIGALTVYSARPDAFHSDEMLLLTELANFLAYGISAIRMREQQKQAEYALRQSEERLRSLGDNLPDSYVYQYTYNQDGSLRILYLSAGVERLHGVNAEDAMCDTSLLSRQINEEQVPDFIAAELVSRETMADYEIELEMLHSDGNLHWLQLRSHPRRAADGSIEWDGVATDITRRKQADAEKQAAEEEKERLGLQLLQAQKMESVGRLAGGVAHDFNNMLGVILGHTEMAMENLDPSDPLYEDLDEIHLAADRSAELTRHLLAFARKQTVVPVVLDLNNTVSGMLKMLRRLIGEDITLAWHPKLDLWPIKVDPSQIDQIMANLCVNARDAISDVGKITLDTGNRSFDDEFCSMNPDFQVGDYVRLSVSDSGCGIDSDTLTHIFEPFFTTKNLGQGTGLGLSTVYGCVSQSNGFIHVYSELGRGTTFNIYIPRYLGSDEITSKKSKDIEVVCGNETILLVEDDYSILRLVYKMLQRLGYQVLTANSLNEAIQVAAEHPNEITLLLTDVVMPEMNGFDLARHLCDLYPNMKSLFMSGYTADVVAIRGLINDDVHLVQKPFTLIELASTLREVLASA